MGQGRINYRSATGAVRITGALYLLYEEARDLPGRLRKIIFRRGLKEIKMVYLIIGLLLLLLYVFATPESIKGTVNIVLVVFAFVALLILLMLSVLQIFQLPTEFFIAIAMLFLAYFSLRDITLMSVSKSKRR